MQVDVNPVSCRIRVDAEEATKWIKRCGWVRIQQCVAQPRLANLAQGQLLSFVTSVTETRFPVPRLEIIAKFPHLTFQPYVKKVIPVGKLDAPDTSVVNGAKPDPGSHGNRGTVNYQSRVS